MAELVCREFDEFAEALQGLDGRYLLTGRSSGEWRLQVADLPGVSLMQGHDGAANLFQAACQPGTYSLFVPIGRGRGLSVNGVALDAGSAAWLVPGTEFHIRASGTHRWLAVMIGPGHWRLSGCEAPGLAPPCACAGRVPRADLVRLMVLSHRILRSGDHPTRVPPAPDLMGSALVEATLRVAVALAGEAQGRRGRPAVARQVVLRRALDLIEDRLCQDDVPLSDLSRTTGVSGRTLQAIFQEQFGLSPHQFIITRRLHGVHEAIRNAGPNDTVSGICARFGIWDFGRFAQAYRLRFGSTPSAMLTRYQSPAASRRRS